MKLNQALKNKNENRSRIQYAYCSKNKKGLCGDGIGNIFFHE